MRKMSLLDLDWILSWLQLIPHDILIVNDTEFSKNFIEKEVQKNIKNRFFWNVNLQIQECFFFSIKFKTYIVYRSKLFSVEHPVWLRFIMHFSS